MARAGWAWALLGLALAVGTPAAADDPRAKVGDVERIQGAAAAVFEGERRPLGLGDPIRFKDQLRTQADSRLKVRLLDDSSVTLGENATLLVDEFVYDPDAGRQVVAVRGLAGAFVLAVADVMNLVERRLEVATPIGSLSLDGGTVWAGEIDDGYGVLALDGTTKVAAATGAYTLAAGEGITVTRPDRPVRVLAWPSLKVRRAIDTVRFADGRVDDGWRAEDDPVAALTGGRPVAQLRYRFEYVDQAGIARTARAHTVRTRAGFETAPLLGFRAMVEGENVSHLGPRRFNDTVDGDRRFPVVADPDDTSFNQYWIASNHLAYSEVKVGRQRLAFDNHRFVGTVGFRQNEQTFDAVRLTTGLVPGYTLDYAYLWLVDRIFGEDSAQGDFALDGHLAHGSRYLEGVGRLTGYAYLLDFDERPDLSSRTFGLRLDGSRDIADDWRALYVAEAAWQGDHGGNPNDDSFVYYLIEPGLAYRTSFLVLGYEVLGGDGARAFQTPLATLHAFQGAADKFLATPADGIADLYLHVGHILTAPQALVGVTLSATLHRFSTDGGDGHYGDELDLEATVPLYEWLSLGLKAAFYDAARFDSDTMKLWLTLDLSY